MRRARGLTTQKHAGLVKLGPTVSKAMALCLLLFLFCVCVYIPENGPEGMLSYPSPNSAIELGTPSDDGYQYSGTGAAYPFTMQGQIASSDPGLLYLDHATSGSSSVTAPTGWTATSLQVSTDYLSTTFDGVLLKGNLNTYHAEKWLGLGYNSEDVHVPDGWALIKAESGAGSGRSTHPGHGIFELVDSAGNGYGDTMGWMFDGSWVSSNVLASSDELYLSQMVSVLARNVQSARVRFLYYPLATSSLYDQTYLFARLGGQEIKLHILEPGDPRGTWIRATVDFTEDMFEDLLTDNSLKLDIGLGTDLSGSQVTARTSQVYIDDIELILDVVPFPEQVDLLANATVISGYLGASSSYDLPDNEYFSGVSSRDCRSYPSAGIQLGGSTGDGNLAVGVTGSDWTTAQAAQVAFQFPIGLPSGRIVTSARLEVEGGSGSSANRAGMRIYVADQDDVVPFTSGLPVVRSRYQWLATSVDWYPSGTWSYETRYLSPDFAALVQQVISRPNWCPGNYICVLLDYAGSTGYSDTNVVGGSAGYSQVDLAKLYIEYAVPQPENVVYEHRKTLSIDHTKVSSDLSDFPVLIDIYDTDLHTDVQRNGGDIAFVFGNKVVPHEIELFDQAYNSTHAHLVAWVEVPLVSSTVDTQIMMCYGGGYANRPSDSSATWASDYEYVAHLSQKSGAGSYVLDSTANRHGGAPVGPVYDANGRIDGARRFGGTSGEYVVVDRGREIFNGWTDWQLSFWLYLDFSSDSQWTSGTAEPRVFYKENSLNLARVYRFSGWPTGEGVIQVDIDFFTSSTEYFTLDVVNRQWFYIVFKYESSGDGYLRGYSYRNGILYDSNSANKGVGDRLVSATSDFALGSPSGTAIAGMIDEFRSVRGYRSLAWIQTEYRNQYNPTGFISVGPEDSWDVGPHNVLTFTTDSESQVVVRPSLSLTVSKTAATLDDGFSPGTTFCAANATHTVWTANLQVSPPVGVTDLGFSMVYPYRDWAPSSVTDPVGTTRSSPSEWMVTSGILTVPSSAVDTYGIWRVEFLQQNSLSDVQMGLSGGSMTTTGSFAINDEVEFRARGPYQTGEMTSFTLRNPAGAVWYSVTNITSASPSHEIPSFRYRKNIVIDHTRVAANLIGFPVLISILDTDLHNPDKVQADGDDILFVSNGHVLPHEIEVFNQNYDATRARLVAWVRGNLSASSDTTITMYYGNPVVGSQANAEAVWTDDYKGVWHLSDALSGAAGEIADSSSCDNDGYTIGYMTSADLVTGKIGSAIDLDGVDDILVVPQSYSMDSLADAGTLEIWVKWVNAADGTYQRVLTTSNRFRESPNTHNDGFEWAVQSGGSHYFYPWGGDGNDYNLAPNPFTNGVWHHLAVSFDYYTKAAILYVDGNPLTLSTQNVPTYWTQLAEIDDWLWGGNGPNAPEGCLAGVFDEIRVSDQVRSGAWILTEFRNQNSPGTFYAVSGESERTSSQPLMRKVFDSTAAAGLWTLTVQYNDTGPVVGSVASLFERQLVVKHSATLEVVSPADSLDDGVAVRVVGSLVSVEVDMTDQITLGAVGGALVTMNWTQAGMPTWIPLDDYGTGRYGVALNTSDLGTKGTWRVNIRSQHDYYSDASVSFNIELSHRIELSYETAEATPVGDNLALKVTLRDAYDGTPIAGAQITANDTLVGVPTDFGNGSYILAFSGAGRGIGDFGFEVYADPAQACLLNGSVVLTMSTRPIDTMMSTAGLNPQNVPWGMTVNATLHWTDLDHGMTGIVGGTVSGEGVFEWTDAGDGDYMLRLDVSSSNLGVHLFRFWLSRTDYATSDIVLAVSVVAHRTDIIVTCNSSVPHGANTYLSIQFRDLDLGGTLIEGNFTQIAVQWSGGSSNYGSKQFWLQTYEWPTGFHLVNITLLAASSPRYYMDARTAVQVYVTKLTVGMAWNDVSAFPVGDDFIMTVNLTVNNPSSVHHGDPVLGLVQSHFRAEDEFGALYSIGAFSALGEGRYRITIDYLNFPSGNYTIRVRVIFATEESYRNSQTPVIGFIYRQARASLSSPDYPLSVCPYGSNATITLEFEDLDRVQGIEGAAIVAQGATIVSTQDLGTGRYLVTLQTYAWGIGLYNVNLTASASGYDSQFLLIDIRVRQIRTYAAPTVGLLDIPVGDTKVFYVDFVDMDHDLAIESAAGLCNWSAEHYTVEWTGSRYRILIHTFETDSLGGYLLVFSFTKNLNYETGYFTIPMSIRTIDTIFRLVAPVEPTSASRNIEVLVYYGDKDHALGIVSAFIECTVSNGTDSVLFTWTNGTSAGYYDIAIDASQFGGLGVQYLTISLHWTGAFQKYQDKVLSVNAVILGEESTLTLLDASLASPCLSNMTYSFLYADTYGTPISNSTGFVIIDVLFLGQTIDMSQVDIWESGAGIYSIRFNNTILAGIGLYSMNVYVNWSSGVWPYYTNRTDAMSVRILPRSTLLSVLPPTIVQYGENATFSFTFEDLTSGTSTVIGYQPAQMAVTLSLSDFAMAYNSMSGIYTISFNTSQFGSPLGQRVFTLDITWSSIPFYMNKTGRQVYVTIIARSTILSYPAPPPTPYAENATFIVTWTDVTGGFSRGINGATVSLFLGTNPIASTYYEVAGTGGGQYEIVLDTSCFTSPGTYSVTVCVTSSVFYVEDANSTRSLTVDSRSTILTAEPPGEVPYDEPLVLAVRYQDLTTLQAIANMTGVPVSVAVLNGTDWLFTCTWREAFQDYLLSIDTRGHMLSVGVAYFLSLNFNCAYVSPFYESATVSVQFQIGYRATTLNLISSPLPTSYLEYANFTVFYQEYESHVGIVGADISLYYAAALLHESSDYLLSRGLNGRYTLSIATVSLGVPGNKLLTLVASWSSGAPFYGNASIEMRVKVTGRSTTVEVLIPPSQTRYLDNVTFDVAYVDSLTSQRITVVADAIQVFSDGFLLDSTEYSVWSFGSVIRITLNSTVLSLALVERWNVTVMVSWGESTPYYLDARTSILVTTISRVGIISLQQLMPTPLGDNVSISLSFRDESTGTPIEGATLTLSCVQKPGLVLNSDYWVIQGSGVGAGTYTILVSTSSLGSTGTFNFILDVLWSLSLSPYYSNVTGIGLSGVVRLSYVSAVSSPPEPSLLPLHESIFFIVNLTDIDHIRGITGATGAMSLRYKSTGQAPLAWSIAELSGGLYNITVHVTENLSPGLQALVLSMSQYPYQSFQTEVVFQVRLRVGVLTAEIGPTNYAGDPTYVVVHLMDLDSGEAPIVGASLSVNWGDAVSWDDLGDGRYNVTLQSSSLTHGPQFLDMGASCSYYDIQVLRLMINLLPVPSELALRWTGPDSSSPTDVLWGDALTIFAAFNDTLHGSLVSGAIVTYSWIGGNGTLVSTSIPGNYSADVDTTAGAIGDTLTITITAVAPNYLQATGRIVFRLQSRSMEIGPADYQYGFSVNRATPAVITVYLRDQVTGLPITSANVTLDWAFGSGLPLSSVAGEPGHYQIVLDTSRTDIDSYRLEITALKANYQQKSTALIMTIAQILLEVQADASTQTYGQAGVYWSELVRIGVYVVAPDLNMTGISACDVTWYCPELGTSGTMLNGTDVGGPGYFYLDFNTTESSATIHTFRILASATSRDYTGAESTVVVFVKNLRTIVSSPGTIEVIWGWTGFVNFTYEDILHSAGIEEAETEYLWAGGTGTLVEMAGGTYFFSLNTTAVRPATYMVRVSFMKANYDDSELTIAIRVAPVPTESLVIVPAYHFSAGDPTQLVVPYNDVLEISLFYNDTYNAIGIPGARIEEAMFSGPGFFEEPLSLVERGLGNYSFLFDTRLWSIGSAFTFSVTFSLDNHTTSTLMFDLTIIEIPTGLQLEGPSHVSLNYGENATIWLSYFDTWAGHAAEAIEGAAIQVSVEGTPAVQTEIAGPDPSRPGWYGVRVFALRLTGSSTITITLNRTYYSTKSVQVIVSVSPSETDIVIQNVITYGSAALLMVGIIGYVWVRILKVPKIVRKIRGMLRQLGRGRVPKPDRTARSRQAILSELYNELYEPLGMKRSATSFAAESIKLDVPEIETMLADLVVLTSMTPKEMDDFRFELSKMRPSEQTSLVKEVIIQEVDKLARQRGATPEEILNEVREERVRRVGLTGAGATYTAAISAAPEAAKPVEKERPKDRLSDSEIEEMKAELLKRGLPEVEVEALAVQSRELPRDVGEMLLRSFGEKGKPERHEVPEDRMSEKELAGLRTKLESKKIPSREIEALVSQARELPRQLAEELLKSYERPPQEAARPATTGMLTEEELDKLRGELELQGLPSEEVESIVEEARTVPRDLVGEFLEKVRGSLPPEPGEGIEFEDRLAEHEIQDLREQLRARGLPEPEIKAIVEQAKNLPRALIDDLLKSIDSGEP